MRHTWTGGGTSSGVWAPGPAGVCSEAAGLTVKKVEKEGVDRSTCSRCPAQLEPSPTKPGLHSQLTSETQNT